MAKTGIRFVVFAPLDVKVNDARHSSAHTGDAYDPYGETNYDKWLIRDVPHDVYPSVSQEQYVYLKYSQLINLTSIVALNGSMNNAAAKDYGDDIVTDTEIDFSGGTLSLEINRDSTSVYSYLLQGNYRTGINLDKIQVPKRSINTMEMSFDVNRVVPYVGVGAIGRSNGKWVSKWYPLVKFRHPNDDNQTRQETPHFGHVTLEGDIFQTKYGIWKRTKTFSRLEDAKAWFMSQIIQSGWTEVAE